MKNFQNYQIPLRLSDDLAFKLHDVSEQTGIQKSKLCRMGISRIVNDIQEMGGLESIRSLNQHYQEIL